MMFRILTLSLAALCLYSVPVAAQTSEPNAAQKSLRRIIQPVPVTGASVKNIYRVSAAKTPSGFPVPRYVSLKVGKVNGRTGPSRQHPIAWQYRRKGLPLVVVAETEMWRKVRDVTGDESWIHKPALSGVRRVLVLEDASLHNRAKPNAKVVALVERNALLELESCNEDDWCRVRSTDGLKGWTERYKLWGAQKLY